MSSLELWVEQEAGWGANTDGQGFNKLALGVTATRRLTEDPLAVTFKVSPEFTELGAEDTVYRLGGQAGLGVLFRVDRSLFHVGVSGVPSWNFKNNELNVDAELSGRYLHIVRSASQRLALGVGLFGRTTVVGELGSNSPVAGVALSALADWDNFF